MEPQKRHRITNLKLNEISTVDRPAQVGAVAVLMKRADDGPEVDIRKNAAAVAGGAAPDFTYLQYEDAMLLRAEELGREQRTTPEQALAKGLSTDRTLMDLAHACEVARCGAYAVEVWKRLSGG